MRFTIEVLWFLSKDDWFTTITDIDAGGACSKSSIFDFWISYKFVCCMLHLMIKEGSRLFKITFQSFWRVSHHFASACKRCWIFFYVIGTITVQLLCVIPTYLKYVYFIVNEILWIILKPLMLPTNRKMLNQMYCKANVEAT